MKKVRESQGQASTSSGIVASFAHSRIKVKGDLYGFYNQITYGSKET